MTYEWIRKDVAVAIHDIQVAEHGGENGIRDEGLLESALFRPVNKHGYDGADLSAATSSYAYGIIKNHPFVDGNKRTALVVCLLFLELNGYELELSQEELYHIFNGLAEKNVSESEFSKIIKNSMIKK